MSINTFHHQYREWAEILNSPKPLPQVLSSIPMLKCKDIYIYIYIP